MEENKEKLGQICYCIHTFLLHHWGVFLLQQPESLRHGRVLKKQNSVQRADTRLCMLSSFSCVWLFVTLWTIAHPLGLLCLWGSPGKNTGMGCLSLLQGIFPTQGLNLGFLHCRQILYHLSHQGSLMKILLIYFFLYCGKIASQVAQW